MSKWMQPTEEVLAKWKEWLAGRPPHVRVVAEKYDPWTVFRLGKSANAKRVIVTGYDEFPDGVVALRVMVTQPLNNDTFLAFERTVIGISQEELAECELPPGGVNADDVVDAIDRLDEVIELPGETLDEVVEKKGLN